jgi:predicted DNA-binding transcriptional regulator AlpA
VTAHAAQVNTVVLGLPKAREVVSSDNILGLDPLLTVADVATLLAVDLSWVYAHKAELNAIPLGTGLKPRLRFRRSSIEAYLERASCQAGRESEKQETPANKPIKRRRRRTRMGTDVELLPIRGRSAA